MPRSSCLPALSALQLKAITTLKKLSFYHLETIEQSSMLVLLQMELKVDLLDLIYSVLFGLIRPLNLHFRSKTNVPDVSQYCYCCVVLVQRFDLVRFDLLFQYLNSVFYIRSKADAPNPKSQAQCRPVVNKLIQTCAHFRLGFSGLQNKVYERDLNLWVKT